MKNTRNKYDTKFRKSDTLRLLLPLVMAVIFCLSPLYGQVRAPIDVNLIIDSSAAFAGVKDEISAWVGGRLDQILVNGDRVTVWSAGSSARIVYTGTIGGASDAEAVKKSIREINASGNNPDFAGALRAAAQRQSSGFSYTLLISASPAALSTVISGSQSNLLRFSRIEEFTNWRALVVGLNLDNKVRSAASAFYGS